jgi:hypothetical protein
MVKKTIKRILLVIAIIVGGYVIFRCVESNINNSNVYKVKVGMTKEQVKGIMGEPDKEFITRGQPAYLYRTFPPLQLYEPLVILFKDSTFIVERVWRKR